MEKVKSCPAGGLNCGDLVPTVQVHGLSNHLTSNHSTEAHMVAQLVHLDNGLCSTLMFKRLCSQVPLFHSTVY